MDVNFNKQLDQMLSIFEVGNNNFLEVPIKNSSLGTKVNNVLLLNKDEGISKIVSEGVKIDKLIKKLTSELKSISSHLKLYSKVRIDKWNRDNFDNVKSAKVPSEDNASALITVKSVNKIDKDIISQCKAYIDKSTFDSIFLEKATFTLKEEFADKLMSLLRKVLGDDFIENSFIKTTQYNLKDKNKLDEFLNNENVDEKLRDKIKNAVKLTEISITY